MNRALVCFVLCLFTNACTTATIHLKDGSQMEVEIRGGDETTIAVAEPHSAQIGLIQREEIKDIDHPGGVLASIFTPLSGVGLSLVVAGFAWSIYGSYHQSNIADAPIIVYAAIILIIPGAVIMGLTTPPAVVGWVNWSRSKAASSLPEDAAPSLTIVPLALTDGEDTYYGAGLGFTF